MRQMTQLWLSTLFLFLVGCTSLSAMKLVDLRNTSEFPNYDISAFVDKACIRDLVKSDKRTRDEFIAQWENATDEELVMLWLWHNGEVREIYRLPPQTLARTSLLDGMGIAVVSERSGECLFSQVVIGESMAGVIQRLD
jgi:hypothetical protein